MRARQLLIAGLIGLVCTTIRAQVLDLQNGRGPVVPKVGKFFLEGGICAGDADYVGVRGTFSLSDRLVAGVDLGDADAGDGLALGAFAQYELALKLPVPLAVRGGYARSLDSDGDLSDLSIEAVTGGPITDIIQWYANAGFHFVTIEYGHGRGHFGRNRDGFDDDDFAPSVGGGAVFQIAKQASAYVGLDLLLGDIYDDAVLGGGFRWAFK